MLPRLVVSDDRTVVPDSSAECVAPDAAAAGVDTVITASAAATGITFIDVDIRAAPSCPGPLDDHPPWTTG